MSLVETLMGALIIASVTGSVYMLYTTMLNTTSRGELMSDLQQNARIGLAKMTQEMRMTGYDPTGIISLVKLPPKAAIRAATPGCFSFVADVSASGAGPASQITYDMSGGSLQRRQDDWQAGNKRFSKEKPEPLAGSVDVLSFTYYDADNQVLEPPEWLSKQRCPPDTGADAETIKQLTFDQMRLVRRVTITLKVQGSRPGVFPQFFTLTSDVRLRNL